LGSLGAFSLLAAGAAWPPAARTALPALPSAAGLACAPSAPAAQRKPARAPGATPPVSASWAVAGAGSGRVANPAHGTFWAAAPARTCSGVQHRCEGNTGTRRIARGAGVPVGAACAIAILVYRCLVTQQGRLAALCSYRCVLAPSCLPWAPSRSHRLVLRAARRWPGSSRLSGR